MNEYMPYGRLPGIEVPLSRLVQGTTMLDSQDLPASMALLDAVFALGCTAFDTAHVYGNGEKERVFGQWLHARGLRNRVVIIGKGAHHNQDRRRVTPFDIAADLHDSLARMGVDQIDLYLLHRDDPAVPVGPLVEALHAQREAGRMRAYGASNWSHERIAEANAYAAAHDRAPFVASSPQYSLARQVQPPWPECVSISGPQGQAARAWYAETGMPLLCWSSLAGGFLSGRISRDNQAALTEAGDRLASASYGAEDNFVRLERAQALATRKGLSLPQIALAYVHSQPLDTYALVGCRSGDEFAHNLVAATTRLSADECAWLDLRQDEAPAGDVSSTSA